MKPARSIKFLLFTLIVFTGQSFNSYAGPVCGNTKVETGEQCDTGEAATNLCNNNTDPNGGNGTCQYTICGDSITQSPNGVGFDEDCDDGVATATCSDICETITATTTSTTSTTTTSSTSTTTTTGVVEPTTTTLVVKPTTTTLVVKPTTTTGVAPTTTTVVVAPTTTQAPGECSGTIVIGKCDSGVSNRSVGGQCLSDIIADCAGGRNHGTDVRCVAFATRDLKGSGDITGKEKGSINKCEAMSNRPASSNRGKKNKNR